MNYIEDMATPELIGHSRAVMIRHEIKLRCPICLMVQVYTATSPVPDNMAAYDEIASDLIETFRREHVLDCIGKKIT